MGSLYPVWAPTNPVGESNWVHVSVLSIEEHVQPIRPIFVAFIWLLITQNQHAQLKPTPAGKVLKRHCPWAFARLQGLQGLPERLERVLSRVYNMTPATLRTLTRTLARCQTGRWTIYNMYRRASERSGISATYPPTRMLVGSNV